MTHSHPIKMDFSNRLRQALAPEQSRLLNIVAEEAIHLHLPLYIVGGFVRDLILGAPGLDFDLVVEGDAIALATAVAHRLGGKITAHTRFKTAQWFPTPATDLPKVVDFTSARSEDYKHPAALPTVRPGTLIDDLRRRDFTINTLAIRLDGENFGELRDDWGGLEDIHNRILRVLHPASFTDDPTRLFRMVRYEQRYRFEIARESLAFIPPALPFINQLSAERVRHELDLAIEEETAALVINRLAKLNILAAVHSALVWDRDSKRRFVYGLDGVSTLEHPPSRRMLGWSLWLMTIPRSGLESIEKRLHFESGLRDVLLAASALFETVNALARNKPSQCVATLDEIPLKAVQSVFLSLPDGPVRRVLHTYLITWRYIKPHTTGHDLKKRGLLPGPEYKTILRRLRNAWLDGEVKSVKEELVLLDNLKR
jgi:tRNA nucleotidyltransferase (CCA-adding enzyme)